MKKRSYLHLFLIGCLLLAMMACDFSSKEETDPETEKLKLQVTLQALQMTQAAAANSQNQAAQPAQPAQPAPQDASSGSDSSSSDESSSDDEDNGSDSDDDEDEDEDEIPCNSSRMVSETIPDFSSFAAGETFEKSWTLRNAGTCDWNEDYVFVFEEGDQMGGESSIKVNTVIEPGETVTFLVHLKAPAANGDYTGVWRLKSDDGEKLGKYWVKIKVGGGGAPAGLFAVTSVAFTTPATPIDLICPDDVTVTATITASAAGTVTYEWEDCEGGSKTGSVVFDAAGNKSVSHTVKNINSSDIHWARIYIDTPNHQWFGPVEFQVVCNP